MTLPRKLPHPLRSLLLLTLVACLCACSKSGSSSRTPAPAAEEPAALIVTEIDEAVMVYIPPGEFLQGTSDDDVEEYKVLFPLRDPAVFNDERPQRRVYLDGYYIDKLEVTNVQFRKFLAETGYKASGYVNSPPHNAATLPAVVLRWEDAAAYAAWAGKRLPTEAEWEKAARGTDGRFWPWGDDWDPTRLSGNDGTGTIDGYVNAAPVGSFPQGQSPYGVLDLAGNVWEYTADWYDPDYYSEAPGVNPRGPASGDGHVVRGGGWAESLDFTRCASRIGGNPGSILRGFRCAMDVPEKE